MCQAYVFPPAKLFTSYLTLVYISSLVFEWILQYWITTAVVDVALNRSVYHGAVVDSRLKRSAHTHTLLLNIASLGSCLPAGVCPLLRLMGGAAHAGKREIRGKGKLGGHDAMLSYTHTGVSVAHGALTLGT